MGKEHIIAGSSILTIYRSENKIQGFKIESGQIPAEDGPEAPGIPEGPEQPLEDVRVRYLAKDFEIFKDGPGGNLWKDADASDRGVVVLFDPSFGDEQGEEFKSVKAYNRKGKHLADFEFTGFANPHADKDRQHWRTSKKANEFPRIVLLEADGQLFKVQNAKGRVD